MKNLIGSSKRWIFSAITLVLALQMGVAQSSQTESAKFAKISGSVYDRASSVGIPQATVKWNNTNIVVFTNSDGKFSIKSDEINDSSSLEINSLGYQKKIVLVKELTNNENKIYLTISPINLSQINVFPTDPNLLVRTVLANKYENYMDEPVFATAFYRETIKKGWSYASLSEAVLSINKQPYRSSKADQMELIQGRKSTDYSKIDTISFNLEGGPFSAIRMDILKEPYLLFDAEDIDKYDFKMGSTLPSEDNLNYVVEFSQKDGITEPLFFGKLYIDPKKLVIVKAVFSMNLKNKEEATQIFIKHKPVGAKVTPTMATYTVTYNEKDGKWFYAYSKGEVNFKVKWDKKFFKSNYLTTIEMAVTNWTKSERKNISSATRLKSNVRMNQAVDGFKNPEFWGNYNIIEPELPIEKAIEKIKKNLETK